MKQDLVGKIFSRLTVLESVGSSNGYINYKCQCSCGEITIVQSRHLNNGRTKSCGCLHKEVAKDRGLSNKRHGLTRTPTYTVWVNLIGRCSNPKNPRYKDYGERGITVCLEWRVFENFLRDMGEKPSGLSLEREDNNLGYSKDNCVWATRFEQGANKRNSKVLYINGMPVIQAQAERDLGLKPGTLKYWLKTGKAFKEFPQLSLTK